MRIGIIINPHHRGSARAYQALTAVLGRPNPYRSMSTTRAWPGGPRARQLLDWGADLIVVLGGDGTLRAVAPVLAGQTVGPKDRVPVALIPTGSANVLAANLGVKSVDTALTIVADFVGGGAGSLAAGLRRVCVPVNAAEIRRHADTTQPQTLEPFLSMAGIGGDAEAVAGWARINGTFGYLLGAARALTYPGLTVAPRSTVESTDTPWAVMASKVSHPAGPIAVFPHAKLDRPEFEFLRVSAASGLERWKRWCSIARESVKGTPDRDPAMTYWRGRDMSVTLREPARVHLDGDNLGEVIALSVHAGTSTIEVLAPRLS